MKKSFILFFIVFFTNVFAQDKTVNIDTLKTTNKQVMVYLHMNNCPYCNRMSNSTLKNTPIRNTIKENFVFVDINVDEVGQVIFNDTTFTHKEFSNHLDINFYPTVLFFDNENEVTYQARGFRSIEKFTDVLNYMKTYAFEDMSFFDYTELKTVK